MEVAKAKRENRAPDPKIMDEPSASPEMNNLVKRMQQEMMLIQTSVIQGMHDNYKRIVKENYLSLEKVVQSLRQIEELLFKMQES